MDKSLNILRITYALAMIGLCVLGFINVDFIIGRPPQSVAALQLPWLVIVANAIVVVACIAIAAQIMAFEAGVLIAAVVFLLSFSRHVVSEFSDWLNALKCLALVGGGLAAAVASRGHKRPQVLLWIVAIFLASFFIACGYAHYHYYDFVKEFIPAYIPYRGFFTYFTAVCLVAGGLGLLIPPVRSIAAWMCGLMIGGWFLLLHIPRVIQNPADPSDRMGLFESLAFAVACFTLSKIFSDRRLKY